MKISLQTILYFSEWDEFETGPGVCRDTCFSDVLLLDRNVEEAHGEYLYTGTAEEAEEYLRTWNGLKKRLHLIVLAEDVCQARRLPEWVSWVWVPRSPGLVAVYNQIRGIFYRLRSWDKKLDEIILTGQNMDVMLETYTELLPHHLLMWDASFNICAFTRNIEAPNENVEEMEKKGYFLPETVEFLVRKNLIAKSTDINTRFFTRDMLPSGNQAIIHHYFRQGLRFYSVCVYAREGQNFGQDIQDLIEYFFGRLNFYLDKHAPVFQGQHFLYESFLIGLLEGKVTDLAVIEERAESFRIRPVAAYRLYCLQINDYKITLARYLIETIASSAPDVKLLQYQNHVLMLKAQSRRGVQTEEESQNWTERVTRLLMIHNAHCGVSSAFSHLKDIRTAYDQARSALESGMLLNPKEKSRIYFYRDYYLYHVLKQVENNIPLSSLYPRRLNQILEKDLKSGANNLKLLDAYLANNQSVTATARQMFMHRNSVIYRIRKIEEMLRIDLENHKDVVRMDFSLCVLRYLFWTNKKYEKYRSLLENEDDEGASE